MPQKRNYAVELAAERLARVMPGTRRISADPEAIAHIAIEQYGAIQKPGELAGFLSVVKAMKAERVLEIGTARGGTLFGLSQMATDNAHLLSVDMPCGSGGGGYQLRDELKFARFRVRGQTHRYIRADSQDVTSGFSSTSQRIERALGGKALDCLFIDGDHSYEGAMSDFHNYGPLVREGGIIALHDIVPNPHDDQIEVDKVWEELKPHYATLEIIDPAAYPGLPKDSGGIGIIQK